MIWLIVRANGCQFSVKLRVIKAPELQMEDDEPEYELEREVEDIDIAASDAAIDAAFNAVIDAADAEDSKHVSALKPALINSQMSLALTIHCLDISCKNIPDQGRTFFFLEKVGFISS